jgi:hypothetical protein
MFPATRAQDGALHCAAPCFFPWGRLQRSPGPLYSPLLFGPLCRYHQRTHAQTYKHRPLWPTISISISSQNSDGMQCQLNERNPTITHLHLHHLHLHLCLHLHQPQKVELVYPFFHRSPTTAITTTATTTTTVATKKLNNSPSPLDETCSLHAPHSHHKSQHRSSSPPAARAAAAAVAITIVP